MSYRKLVLIVFAIPVVAVLAIYFMLAVFYGCEYYKTRGHQEFAANGVSQIKPAREMDQIFSDCRHFITYGANDVPLFNSVAYFGDRYELTMQVAVDVQSASTGFAVGSPQYYLLEVREVHDQAGQISATFSRNLNFGAAEWRQIYASRGDFSTIGFNVNTTPVPDFRKFADACRPSN